MLVLSSAADSKAPFKLLCGSGWLLFRLLSENIGGTDELGSPSKLDAGPGETSVLSVEQPVAVGDGSPKDEPQAKLSKGLTMTVVHSDFPAGIFSSLEDSGMDSSGGLSMLTLLLDMGTGLRPPVMQLHTPLHNNITGPREDQTMQ